MSNMHFVFLQGMPSPFFSRIANALAARGCKATAINLCVGDQLFWQGPASVNYKGSYEYWPVFFSDFCKKHAVTDLVLLGEQRRYHKEAISVAHELGVRVTVTDFGYLRPDWITLERDGMSGNSRFFKNKNIMDIATHAPEMEQRKPYADKFWTMARGDLIYSFANVLFGWLLYPHYRRSDMRMHPILYFPAIGLRLLFSKTRNEHAKQVVNNLHVTKAKFFLFPLQLEHDFQIVAYSHYNNMLEPINEVISSFAKSAPKDTKLLIKVHPWDPGVRNWKRYIAERENNYNITGRVDYIDGCTMDEAMQQSLGMITVNSTSGLRALEQGYPVKVLGKAIYDREELTYQGTMDNFWVEAKPPAAPQVLAFMKALAATIQIRGVFFNEPGLTSAVTAATERLYHQKVGEIFDTPSY